MSNTDDAGNVYSGAVDSNMFYASKTVSKNTDEDESKTCQFEQARDNLASTVRTKLDTMVSCSVGSGKSVLKKLCETLTNLASMGELIAVDKEQDLEVNAMVSTNGVVKFQFKLVAPQPLRTTTFTLIKPPEMSDETWEKFSKELSEELEKELTNTDNIGVSND